MFEKPVPRRRKRIQLSEARLLLSPVLFAITDNYNFYVFIRYHRNTKE